MGRLGAARGLKGWLRVKSFADPPEQLENYRAWNLLVNDQYREMTLRRLRTTPRGLECLLEGIDTRDAAEALRGAEIRVNRADLPPAGENEWYWADLKGLEVHNLEGRPLGRVHGLMATGANDVLIVQGERRRLIPFVPGSRVREVDLQERRLIVDWDPAD
ncbi:MAG: 16S rRNA processing protein RimM [Gammaproteobacteria bacterium]|nr:16S rRNA processing protein RimM [Gammaproteobacteria bacterium]MYD02638.1 16S rRNA processing protein RimM [Gammaproteobacteria bacterium]MYI24134.1 16S rRNA processing protein RimM [Gammaproteobacteria bacterium]